ncbi:hypothetical protein LIA77_10209 [Sarocladium implicatum]|nr:hypothetical protein LIA77_10209 [Sarocladium implicatum]
MDVSKFTDYEKRFVLTEMLRTSQVSIDALAQFVADQGVQPDWDQWSMIQIPQGRVLRQCMEMAGELTAQSSQLKRKRADEVPSEANAKRPSFPNLYPTGPTSSHRAASVALSPAPVHIAPRPSNGHKPSPHPSPPPPAPLPKKRGRPSRADKAKRDLRPLLPQHLAPRPSEHSSGAHEPRVILPAPATMAERYPRSPISRPRPAAASSPAQDGTASHVDMTRPRVLSDGAVDHMEKTRAYLGSELPPIEPHLSARSAIQTDADNSPATLAPMLQRSPPGSTPDTSTQGTRSAPLINSA